MPITPLPTPPSRADSANFASRADSFLAALPTFATEANATATEVNNTALNAASSATAASSSAATASQAAINVAMAGTSITGTSTSSVVIGTGSKSLTIETGKSFVAGMPVRIGDTAAPNTNFMDGNVTSYNSGTGALVVNVTGTQGSGTFTSWSVRASSGGAGGAETQTTTVTLTSASKCVQVLNMPAFGHSVQLPSATTLSRGPDLFILDNSWGRFPVGVLDGAGRVLGAVLPGDAVDFDLIDNTTTAGSWRHRGNLDPVWVNFDAGLNLALGSSGLGNSYSIDATRGLLTYRNPSGFPCARLITYSGSGTPTISAELVLVASSESVQGVWLMGSTNRILVRLSGNSVVVVNISNPSTLTVGSSASVTFTSGSLNDIVVLDNQYAIGWANDTTNSVVRARCIDCGASGTTITIGTEVATSTINSYVGVLLAKIASSTAIGFLVRTFSSEWSIAAFTLTRTSGTTLSWSANANAPGGMTTNDSNHPSFDLSADRLLFCYRLTGGSQRYVVITFTAGSAPSYGSVASGNVSAGSGSTFSVVASPNRTRFIAYISFGSNNTHRQCEALSVSGTTVTVGTIANFTASATIYSGSTVSIEVDNNGRGFVTWTSSDASTNSRDKWRTFTLSGTTFTFSTEAGRAPGFPNMDQGSGFVLASLQESLGSGFFRLSASRFSNGLRESRSVVFTVNSDTSINVLASVDCADSTWHISGIQGISDRGLSMQTYTPGSDPGTEAIVFFTSGGFKRGRHLTGFTNLSFTNGQSAPNQRGLLVGVHFPDAQFGRNITINTYRIAEA